MWLRPHRAASIPGQNTDRVDDSNDYDANTAPNRVLDLAELNEFSLPCTLQVVTLVRR